MFIRLKTPGSNDVNTNVGSIKTFTPNNNGEGSFINFNDGSSMAVLDSTRSIRGYVKKAQFQAHTGGLEQSSDQNEAEG